jgi:hypothetical protein
MKLGLIIVVIFAAYTTFGQQKEETWNKFDYLIGNWKGEGSGNPGQGEGSFSFKFDLDKKILIRTNHSEYPATNDKPKTTHDDLMIVYLDFSGRPTKAIYFDNEGHVINYSVTYLNNSDIEFTSEKISNIPVFRLTYSQIDSKSVNVKFEMSQDGEEFITYVEGKCNKID